MLSKASSWFPFPAEGGGGCISCAVREKNTVSRAHDVQVDWYELLQPNNIKCQQAQQVTP